MLLNDTKASKVLVRERELLLKCPEALSLYGASAVVHRTDSSSKALNSYSHT